MPSFLVFHNFSIVLARYYIVSLNFGLCDVSHSEIEDRHFWPEYYVSVDSFSLLCGSGACLFYRNAAKQGLHQGPTLRSLAGGGWEHYVPHPRAHW